MSDARKRAGTSENVVTLTGADDEPARHVSKCLVTMTKQLCEVMRIVERLDIEDEHRVALNGSLLDAGRDLLAAAVTLEKGLRGRGANLPGDQPGVS